MKNFAFVSLVLVAVFLSSCASIKSYCGNFETVTLTRQDIRPIIEVSDSLQTFDIEIVFMGKRVDGMLLIKEQTADTVRVVINSYFGMSIMDFELLPDSFKLHYIFDVLDKPMIIKLFEKDFKLLLGQNIPEQFTAQRGVCRENKNLISINLSEGKHLYKMTHFGLITEVKAPWVSVKDVAKLDTRTITLKHTGFFSPDIIIKKSTSN